MKYNLIIFDCDGTLVDTEYAVNAAFIDKLHELAPPDYQKFDIEYILHNCIGATVYGIFEKMATDVNNPISDEMRDRVIVEYQDIFPEYLKIYVSPDPILIGILQELAEHFKICVASNGRARNVINSLKAAGLADIFGDNIFTAEDVKNPKPAPDLIKYAAKKMGVKDMSRILHIEDADRGVMAGVAAKVNVIGFTKHSKHKAETIAKLIEAGTQEIFDNWEKAALFALNQASK